MQCSTQGERAATHECKILTRAAVTANFTIQRQTPGRIEGGATVHNDRAGRSATGSRIGERATIEGQGAAGAEGAGAGVGNGINTQCAGVNRRATGEYVRAGKRRRPGAIHNHCGGTANCGGYGVVVDAVIEEN